MKPALAAAALALALLAVPSASAKSCSPPERALASLMVKRTSCANGKRVALAYARCRAKNRLAARCETIRGYRCLDRHASPEGAVPTSCSKGRRKVSFTFR